MIKRVDRHIKLSKITSDRLDNYITKMFGDHRPLSAVIERAIVEYLDRKNGNTEIKR